MTIFTNIERLGAYKTLVLSLLSLTYNTHRTEKKAQALADFIVMCTIEKDKSNKVKAPTPPRDLSPRKPSKDPDLCGWIFLETQ